MIKKIPRQLFENLLVILAYYLSAHLSVDFLTTPPTNASLIWPPCGISLAAVLLLGFHVLPAIFIADLIIAIEIVGFSDFVSIMFSLMVGLQAMMTAWIGAILIRRFVGIDNQLIDNKSIFLFFFLGGAISLVLPSAFALGVEYWLGMVDKNEIWLGFFTWWLGGAIGVFIFSPITLILFGGKSQHSRIYSIVIPLSILFVLLVGLFSFTKNIEQQRLESIFQQESHVLHTKTLDKIDNISSELQKFKVFIGLIDELDQETINAFSQNIFTQKSEITALAWLPIVANEERAAFESAIGRAIFEQGQNGKALYSKVNTDHFPVKFVASTLNYKALIGLDFASNNIWKYVLKTAQISVETELITPIFLYQNDKAIKLTAFVMAVFKTDMNTKYLSENKNDLAGYVMLFVPFQSLLNKEIVQAKTQQINLNIAGLGVNSEKVIGPVENNRYKLKIVETITRFRQQLKFTYFPNDNFIISHSSLPVGWVFVLGLGITGLVGFILLSVTGQTTQTRKQVKEKTKALVSKQQLLRTYQNSLHKLVDEQTQELVDKQEELVRNERLATIGSVSGSIAHELRNPLGSIRNAVFYLRRKIPDSEPKWCQYMKIIDDEVGTANQIITNLLEMSRPINLTLTRVSLKAILDEVFETKISEQLSNVSYQFNFKPEPFELQCDPTKMIQVFENLLSNALEDIKTNRKIIVTAIRENDYHIITFQDNGAGIDKKHKAFIFDPLYSTKTKGIGLGLWICSEIIRRHNGTIMLDDNDNFTRFIIRIPHQ